MRTGARAHLSWLAEFLVPWFAVGGDESGADATVTFSVLSDREWAALRSHAGAGAPADVGCFVLDRGVVRHPAWRDGSGACTVLDPELDALYRVDPAARLVEISTGRHEQRARVALMRVVRELALAHAVRSGALPLHAAAVARASRGVLFVGPKRAGKTTLLLKALGVPGLDFVANDRVVAWTADGLARGMPSIVALRPEVLRGSASLARSLRQHGYHHAVTMTEARAGRVSQRTDGAADLTPAQLCDALGTTPTPEATIAAVVFPVASLDGRSSGLERVTPHEALPRMLDGVFGSRATAVSEVFGQLVGGEPAGLPATPERCRRLLARVSAFVCRFDPRTLDAADAAAMVAFASS